MTPLVPTLDISEGLSEKVGKIFIMDLVGVSLRLEKVLWWSGFGKDIWWEGIR